MADDRIEGAVRQGIGKLQDAAGNLLGDSGAQAKGKLNEVAGSAQDAYGKVADQAQDIYEEIEDYVRDQPLVAAAVAAGLGLVLGLVLRGGGRKVVYVRK